MDEVARYRKKKPQTSKSEKRSGHKHQYEKSITVKFSNDESVADFFWSTHCSICGRLGDFKIDNDDFRKPEYVGRSRWWCYDMCLSMEEVKKKFPGIPMYRQDPDCWQKYIRIE